MKKNMQKGITLVALIITVIISLILTGISIQAITNTGLFEQSNRAQKENQRAQVTEWLNLKLMEEQMYKTTGIAEEIIEATRVSSYGNIELEKMGKKVVVDENTSTQEDGEQVDVYFYVQVDEDVYKVEMAGAKFVGVKGSSEVLKTKYKIVYNSNNSNNEKSTDKKIENEEYTILKNSFMAESGYVFKEWNTKSDGAGTKYSVGDKYEIDEELELYAIWEKTEVTVTIQGAVQEKITVEKSEEKLLEVITDANGKAENVTLPVDTLIFTGSVSGQSYKRTIDENTTEILVMPNGALYWYGNVLNPIKSTSYWYGTQDNVTNSEPNLSYEKNYLNLYSSYATSKWNGRCGSIYFQNSIDLTNYSYLKINETGSFVGTFDSGVTNVWTGLQITKKSPTISAYGSDYSIGLGHWYSSNGTSKYPSGELFMDISTFSDNYYIEIYNMSAYTAYILNQINAIWLE